MPIQAGNTTTSTVSFVISINGTALSAEWNVVSVLVYHGVNKIPFVRVVMLDGDAAAADYVQSNAPEVVPGNTLQVEAGYGDERTVVFKGIITRYNIQLKATNTTLLVLEARHPAVRMTKVKKSAVYAEVKDSDVLEQLLAATGVSTDVESTPVLHREMVQYSCTDWDMAISRTEANGSLVICLPEKIEVAPPRLSADAAHTLRFGANILELDLATDARQLWQDAEVHSWNLDDQAMSMANGNAPTGWQEPGNIAVSELAAASGTPAGWAALAVPVSQQEGTQWATALLAKHQLSKVGGRVRCQGIATVWPGTMVQLEGVGQRFIGKHLVAAVRHELNQGNWFTDLELGIQPRLFAEEYAIAEPPAHAMLPPVHGLHTAKVLQLASDPDGQDRVLIKMTALPQADEGVWARHSMADAGAERGIFFRPDVGDEVLVGFISGDPRFPVILGMLNSSALPAVLQPDDDNHQKGIVTREKLKVWFDEEKKRIEISTPGGKTIVLDEEGSTLQLKDEHGNEVLMDDSGISISTEGDLKIKAAGDITLEGMNVELTASAAAKVAGSSGAELSSGGNTKVEGSLVTIN